MKAIKPPDARPALGLLAVFILFAIGLMAAGRMYFTSYEEHFEENVRRHLSSVADMKVEEICRWRNKHVSDASIFFNNPSFSELVSGLQRDPSDTECRRRISDWLARLAATEDYDQIRLLTPGGRTLLSMPEERSSAPEVVVSRLEEVLAGKRLVFQDIYQDKESEDARMSLLVPLQAGNTPAVLQMRIDPDVWLYPIIKRWPETSGTAESYIVRRQGENAVYLNQLRFANNRPLALAAYADGAPHQAALESLKQEGDFEGVDYNNIPVLASLRRVPGTEWSLVSSEAKSEALESVQERYWQIMAHIWTLLFGTGCLFAFFWRQYRLRFYREKAADVELLAASEVKFRKTFELAVIGIAHIALDGRWLRLNPRACEILGYPEEELLKMKFQDTTHPDDLQGCLEMARRIRDGETETEMLEKRYIRKDGTVVSTNVTVALSQGTAGDGPYLISIIDDVTDRRLAENQLREAEERYRNIVELTPDAIFTHSENRIDYINSAGLRLLRAGDRSEVIGRSPLELFDGASRDLIRGRIAELMEKPCQVPWHEQKLLAFDGTIIDVEAAASSYLENGKMLIQVVCRDMTRRKRAEAEMRRSADLLQAVVDGTTDAIFVKDIQGRYLLVNHATAEFAGIPASEILGHDDTRIFNPDDAEKVMACDRMVRESGKAMATELQLSLAGINRIFLGTVGPYLDGTGGIIGSIGTFHDITERKKAEEDIERANSLLNATLESTADGILVVDAEGKVASYNRKFLELWRIPPDLIESNDDHRVIQSILDQLESPERFLAKVEKLYQHPEMDSWDELKFRDGRLFERYSQPQRIGDKIVGRVWSFRDISERKRAEESNARLAKAVDQASEMILITDTKGVIRYVNPSFERTTGFTKEEAFGKNPRILKSGKQTADFYRQMWNTLNKGEVWSGHMTNRRKDGTLFEEEATISPILDTEGKILNFVAVKRDVSREYELQEQFRQAQKMEAVGKLAGGVAHDFNNILGTIMMQAELAAMDPQLTRGMREALDEIRADAMRAANLTRQLLLFSRQQNIQMRDVDLNDVVSNVSRMLQRIIGEDISLTLDLDPQPLPLKGDPGTLEQVMLNLAVNARDAMPAGGKLTITTGHAVVGADGAQAHPEARPGPHVFVETSDNGVGIPLDILPRIFDPFFTTKDVGKGTGLGLATVFGIVKQHGGWINVRSNPGHGTTFRIHLPLHEPSGKPEPAPPAPSIPHGGNETILVTEDEPSLRSLICQILQRGGYQVIEAANCACAMDAWSEAGGRISLLLTDIVMPGGMTGMQLATRLKAEDPELRIILMTGYSVDFSGLESEMPESAKFLQKPFVPDQLLATVAQALGK